MGNLWSRQSKLLASDGALYDSFGSDVSIYGTTAFIGSLLDDDKIADGGMT